MVGGKREGNDNNIPDEQMETLQRDDGGFGGMGEFGMGECVNPHQPLNPNPSPKSRAACVFVFEESERMIF